MKIKKLNKENIIEGKKRGRYLEPDEYDYVIKEYSQDSKGDFWIVDFLLAVIDQGMTIDEIAFLTRAMVNKGLVIDWGDTSIENEKRMDQPSTGGLGNKSPIIVPPIVASCGIFMPKMSTRGSVAGTIDILESVGYNPDISLSSFKYIVQKYHLSNIQQSAEIAWVDKKMMNLRRRMRQSHGVDGMKNAALVISSILSKKVAIGSTHIVIDVKSGRGSKLGNSFEEDQRQAQKFIDVGKKLGLRVSCVLTNGDHPQGLFIGRGLSLIEVVDILKGGGPKDQKNIVISLAGELLRMSGIVESFEKGKEKAQEQINNGQALEKFTQQLLNHGADIQFIDNPGILKKSKFMTSVKSLVSGYISDINYKPLKTITKILLKTTNRDEFKYNTGIELKKSVGDYIGKKEEIAVLYSYGKDISAYLEKTMIQQCFTISDKKVDAPESVLDIIRRNP